MTGSASARRWFALVVALFAAVVTMVVTPAGPAAGHAPPDPSVIDDEGGTPLLRDVLESTGREFLAASTALERSKKRQIELTLELAKLESQAAVLSSEVGELAAVSYRTGRLSAASAMMNSSSSDEFLQRMAALDVLAMRDNEKLKELNAALNAVTRAKAAIEGEIAEQRKQLVIMANKKRDAERALALVGGKATRGFVVATSPVAAPAPRSADGSWPGQSCSRSDPTTSGCLTPRTLHALQQAQAAGFKRFVRCFRPGGPYEHPKGRACDFSAQRSGFGGHAQGGDRFYGNNLAAFFVRNASRLGVLYVIWYRQIWFPATGWRSYSGGGNPASAHTNHVHLSMI